MNIYLLDDPTRPGDFARFSHTGTWAGGGLCKHCGEDSQCLIEPLEIEWNDGTTRIGDFSWCGYAAIVLDEVQSFLRAKAFEVQFGRVDVKRPTAKAVRPRVPFPYFGPHLSWVIATARLALDEERSGVSLLSDCSICGRKSYTFKRAGISILKKAWHGEKIFLIDQFGRSNAMFITEEGLALLKEGNFSNFNALPAGRIER